MTENYEKEIEDMNLLKTNMAEYEKKSKLIKSMSLDLDLIKADIRRSNNITEDRIREWYNEDYSSSETLTSFESFRKKVLEMKGARLEKLSADLARVTEEYNANLESLKSARNEIIKAIEENRPKLEIMLSNRKTEFARIEAQLDIIEENNENDLSSRKTNAWVRALTRKYNELSSDINQIESALQEMDEISETIGSITDEPIEQEMVKDEDIIEIEQNENNTEIDELEIYNMAKEIYDERLADYEDDLAKLYELQYSYENGTVEYSEYENFANEMVERYRSIIEDYGIVEQMKADIDSIDTLSVEDMKRRVLELDSRYKQEYYERAYGENGLVEHDDNFLEDLQTEMKELEERIRVKESIKEPNIPLEPMMILKKTKDTEIVAIEDKDLIEYEKAKNEYDALLAMYEEDLSRLYDLHQALDRDEIEYSEYENFADYMVERYRYIISAYEKVLRMKAELDLFNSMSIDELNSRLSQLEAALNAEYQYRAHGENGLVGHDDNYLEELQEKINKLKRAINRKNNEFGALTDEELQNQLAVLQAEFEREFHYRAHGENGLIGHDDNYIEELQEKIKQIKDELKRRGKLEDPIKPEQPMMAGKKKASGDDEIEDDEIVDDELKNKKYFDLDAMLRRIAKDYKYNKFDNFIYTHKDIKVFNYQKKNSRTFLDKPLKFVKTGIGTVVNGVTKLFSKGAYAVLKERRAKIDELILRIEQLPEAELDAFIKKLSATNMRINRGIIPDIVFNALYNKITQRIQLKTTIANKKIESLYIRLIEQYKKGLEIQEKLNGASNAQEKSSLEKELRIISKDLCSIIREIDIAFTEADSLANAAGRFGMSENYRSKDNTTKGGVNASDKDNPMARNLTGAIGENIENAMNSGDGLTAAKYFLYKERVKIENTIEKRTLKNRFGLANTGGFDHQLFVKYADYSKDTFFSDVIHTVIIITGIMNAINQIKLKEALNEANRKIAVQNAQIKVLNDQVGDLQTILSKYSTNPEEFLKEYYTFIQNNITEMNANAEWFALHAQAAKNGTAVLTSTGDIYNGLDDAQHIFSGDLTSQLKTIYEDTSLSLIDKTKQMGEILAKGQENMAMVIDTHKAGVMDYLDKFGNVDDFRALEQAVLLAGNGTASYVPNLFSDLIEVANITNNMTALNQLSAIDLSVPIYPQLVPVIGLLGADCVEDYRNKKNKREKDEATLEERENKLRDAIMEVPIDVNELAKEIYNKKQAEWDEKGAFYKLFHRSQKPTLKEAQIEAIERSKSL